MGLEDAAKQVRQRDEPVHMLNECMHVERENALQAARGHCGESEAETKVNMSAEEVECPRTPAFRGSVVCEHRRRSAGRARCGWLEGV